MAKQTKRVPWLGGYDTQAAFDAAGKPVDVLVTHGARDILCRVAIPDTPPAGQPATQVDAFKLARKIAVGLALVDYYGAKYRAVRRATDARLLRAMGKWADELKRQNRRFGSYYSFVESGVTP